MLTALLRAARPLAVRPRLARCLSSQHFAADRLQQVSERKTDAWQSRSPGRLSPEQRQHWHSQLSNLSAEADAEPNQFSPSLPIERAWTPPSRWYTDPSMLAVEKETIFQRQWLSVGRRDQVARAGEYLTGMVLGEPYIVIRGDDGELRAFYNVCRHHATRLLDDDEGCGVKALTCPYHGWTYGLDGRLRKATRLKGIKDFSAPRFGLHPIAVEEWGPLVLINFGGQAPTAGGKPRVAEPETALSEVLGELPDVYASTEWDKLRFVRRVNYKLHCGWKIFIDNYCDGGYHVQHAHPALAGALDLDAYETRLGEYYSLQTCPSGGDDDRVSGHAYYSFVYPNLMINRYGPWMDTNIVFPVSANTCVVQFDYYLDESKMGDVEFIRDSLASSHQVQLEDIYLSESVQQGLESSAYDVGRYAPGVEGPMYHFHQLLARDVQRLRA